MPYSWGIETRPAFSTNLLKRYNTGKGLIEKGELEKGCQAWRDLAGALSASGDHLGAAWVWLQTARKQADADRIDAAAASFDLGIAQAQAADRTDVESQLWGYKGKALADANRFAEGEAALRQALAIRERAGVDSLAVAYCLDQLVLDAGMADEAAQTRALRIWKRLAPGSAAEAASLTAIARNARYRGSFQEALDLQRQALAIHRQIDETGLQVAMAIKGLCVFEAESHNLAAAEQHCAKALELSSRLQGKEALTLGAASLMNLGQMALERGEFERAKQLNLRALALRERAEGSESIGHPLARLGGVALVQGKLDEAEELLLRAEKLLGAKLSPGHPYRAVLKNMLAEVAYHKGDYPKALALLKEAAALVALQAPDGIDAAWICNDLGQVLARLGETAEAETQLRRALDLRRRHSPASFETAESRHALGMLLWKNRRLAEAESELRRSVEDLESQQARLGGSEEAQSAFGAQFADYYTDYMRLLMELGREQDSFFLLERYRAGSFLRTLAQRDLALSADVPAELERARRLANEEYDRTQGQIRALNPKDDAKKIEEGLVRLAELRQNQAEIAERIRQASPRYGALQYPQPLDLTGTRAALDPGTLLLSYSVSEEKSYLFAVSSDPKRGPLLTVVALPSGEKPLRETVEAFRRQISRKAPLPDLLARSRALYDTLIKPVEALIARHDRLLITAGWSAAHASLGGPRPRREGRPARVSRRVEAHPHGGFRHGICGTEEVCEEADRREPAIEVAAFGDPRYPAPAAGKTAVMRSDGTEGEEDAYGEAELDAVLRGGYKFEPLPRTRQEVETIASLYAPRSQAYLGMQATEERARSIGKDVPLIHYACHAYVNERFPLDSALVFTIPENPKPGQDNGLLQAWEIFERVRIDADLVTLSACDSGLGKEMGGEGLIGLTRAFQYAGARTVLASLWKVEDASTAELMKRFYGYLKSGKTKDEALRLAQIDLIRSPNYSQPRDWAAFELMGDWK